MLMVTEGDQSKKLRGNYAGIGYTYDEDNNIFWPKQPHASWTKNTSTAGWDSPITYPSVTDDGARSSSFGIRNLMERNSISSR